MSYVYSEEQKARKKEQNRIAYLLNKADPVWMANRRAYQEKLKADPVYREKMRIRSLGAPPWVAKPEDRERVAAARRVAVAKYRATPKGVEKTRKYKKAYLATPEGRLENRIRVRLNNAFKRVGLDKKNRTFAIVGADTPFLHKWIESQFLEGMSFDNREKWHIDHKIPLSVGKTEEELQLLCHYSNLRPLWAADDIRKFTSHEYATREEALAAAKLAKEEAERIYSVPPVFPDSSK